MLKKFTVTTLKIVNRNSLQYAHLQKMHKKSEKTFMKIRKMDIFEMSKIRNIGKRFPEKSVVLFFKYNNLFKK